MKENEDMFIIEEDENVEFFNELDEYEEEMMLTQSAKNQKALLFLINKYGPDISLQEALDGYKSEEGEDLDKTYYDSWAPKYDYENRPLKITDIFYYLRASQKEVEEIVETMKRENADVMVFVPYYDENGELDPGYYEGLVKTEFVTRHILDHDFQYGALKWGYYNGVFRFTLFESELLHFVAYFNHRLNLSTPEKVIEEIEAKNKWYDENMVKYANWEEREETYREWMLKYMKDHSNED